MNSTCSSIGNSPHFSNKISGQASIDLLKLIFYEKKNIKQAAKYLNINYSIAKKIVRQFQKKRMCLEKEYNDEYNQLRRHVDGNTKKHFIIQSNNYDTFIRKKESITGMDEKINEVAMLIKELSNEILQNQRLLIGFYNEITSTVTNSTAYFALNYNHKDHRQINNDCCFQTNC